MTIPKKVNKIVILMKEESNNMDYNPYCYAIHCCEFIVEKLKCGEIWGYRWIDNPEAKISHACQAGFVVGDIPESSHNFVIVDEYLIDYWAHDYCENPIIYHLINDKNQIKKLYGNRKLWKK